MGNPQTYPRRSHLDRLEPRMFLTVTAVGSLINVTNDLVASPLGSTDRNTVVAMDADGDFTVGWESGGALGSPGSRLVHGARYTASGVLSSYINPYSESFYVTQGGSFAQLGPDVSLTGDGRLAFSAIRGVTFMPVQIPAVYSPDLYNLGTGSTVLWKATDAAVNSSLLRTGVSVTDSGIAYLITYGDSDSGVSGNMYSYDLNSSSSGFTPISGLLAGPADITAVNSTTSILARNRAGVIQVRKVVSGVFTTLADANSSGAPDAGILPAVASDSQGRFAVIWSASSGTVLRGQRYDANGAKSGAEFVIRSGFPQSYRFDAAMDDDGNLVVVWAGTDGTSASAVKARLYYADGTPDGSEFTVSSLSDVSFATVVPAVSMSDDNKFVVAWGCDQFFSNSGGTRVRAQRYSFTAPVFDTTPPTLQSVVFNYLTSGSPTSVLVQFSEPVTGLTLSNNFATTSFILAVGSPAFPVAAANLSLTFPSPSQALINFNFPNGVIEDGDYGLQVIAANVKDLSGNVMAANPSPSFFWFLNGDANRDRSVNTTDFNLLAGSFGSSGKNFADGDFNFDGQIGSTDFDILVGQYGKVLAPAAAPSAGPVSSLWRAALPLQTDASEESDDLF